MAGGTRRVVTGAHYGLRDWIAQRITAVVLVLFLLVVLVSVLAHGGLDYASWSAVFAPQPMKLLTELAFLALYFHAWVGVRDIWMDYVKPVGVRLALHVGTILWLLYCMAWSVQILWSV